MSTHHLRRLAVVAVAGTVLLSGCGSARPGVAAQVGDDTITLSDVDEQSQLICQAVEKDLQSPLPMGLARYQILTGQISRSIADQVAEEYDVEPDAGYDSALSAARTQVAAYPEETRETLITVSTNQVYVQSIMEAAARKALADEGTTDPTVDEVTKRSQQMFSQWADTHTVEIDPRFGFDFADGTFARVETGVSHAVSDTATAGLKPEPDPAVTAELPVAQRCG